MGYVECLPLQNAFGPDARFFILDPPKDANGNSTRYLVLQRALASVGICFQYHLRAVSCEAFAMTMMNAEPDWRSLQLQVLNNTMVTSVKMTKEKRQADAAMYQEFYSSIVARWRMLDQPVILTLKYLVNTYTMRKVLRYWYLNFCCGLIKVTQLLMDFLVSVCVPYEIVIIKLVRV